LKTKQQINSEIQEAEIWIEEAFRSQDLSRWQYFRGWRDALKWVLSED
jgi:hypothetical protein